jgi:hypothetical protein
MGVGGGIYESKFLTPSFALPEGGVRDVFTRHVSCLLNILHGSHQNVIEMCGIGYVVVCVIHLVTTTDTFCI